MVRMKVEIGVRIKNVRMSAKKFQFEKKNIVPFRKTN